MPSIFNESDPKAVPEAPTGRSVPDFPIAGVIAAQENEDTAQNVPVAADMTPEDNAPEPENVEEPVIEEKPIITEPEAEEATPAPAEEPSPEPEPEPEQPDEEVEKDEPPVAESTGGAEETPVAPAGGFNKSDGPEAASAAASRLVTALTNLTAKNAAPVKRSTAEDFMTPLVDAANRAERTAIKNTVLKLQAECVHAGQFIDVVSIQHVLDFLESKMASGTRVRKTAEEKAHEKRVKDSREGATVLVAVFELLKSVIPDGVDVMSVARKDAEDLLVEVGQHIKWTEGGRIPEEEPKLSTLGKRALATFRAGVKGIKLEEDVSPSVAQVVNVKDNPHKVSTPDEPVREKSVRVHVESLFARLQPGQWVSVDQVVAQPSSEYPDKKGQRPDAAAVRAVIYGDGDVKGIDGVSGYTHEGLDGGWKPVS